jgi:hypothetical protein
MSDEDVFRFTEETLTQLFLLIDKGDITSEQAYDIFMATPVSKVMLALEASARGEEPEEENSTVKIKLWEIAEEVNRGIISSNTAQIFIL